MPKPAKLKDLLQPGNRDLGRVLARAAELEALTEKVQAALGEPESGHIVAVGTDQESLTVTVDAAAWAARLRFLENEIRAAAGPGMATKKLLVRVRPPAPP